MAEKTIRRPQKALTVRRVETLTEPGKYFDGNGLFLRITKAGSKQWVQRLTVRGKRVEIGLGSPPAVSLATARKVALENRGIAMQGGDPLANKKAERAALTFAEVVEEYLAAKLDEFRNPKHRQQWRNTLETYALPKIGTKRVAEIDLQDVHAVLHPIWREKTETASRLRGRIENVLSWATVKGHRSGPNPAIWRGNLSEVLPKPNKVATVTNQPAVALQDLAQWWADLQSREGMAAEALRFAVLTAARSGEVRGATWDEFDMDGGETGPVWNVPAQRMKNKRPHRVPLTQQAVALLEALPRMEGAVHVFFAPRGGMLSDMSLSAVMRRMQAAQVKAGKAGYLDAASKRPAVPHGLRSTFRVWATEQGYDHHMAEIALAHWQGDETERAYQRSDMVERRRAMMADWAEFLHKGEIKNG